MKKIILLTSICAGLLLAGTKSASALVSINLRSPGGKILHPRFQNNATFFQIKCFVAKQFSVQLSEVTLTASGQALDGDSTLLDFLVAEFAVLNGRAPTDNELNDSGYMEALFKSIEFVARVTAPPPSVVVPPPPAAPPSCSAKPVRPPRRESALPLPAPPPQSVHNLNRFTLAQEQGRDGSRIEQALTELAHGKKESHWIWYIFPQVTGLGSSEISLRYAIANMKEATEYLRNETLRSNYVGAVKAALSSRKPAQAIFGDDAIKLHSSLTLFSLAAGENYDRELENLISEALGQFFGGSLDEATLHILLEQAQRRS